MTLVVGPGHTWTKARLNVLPVGVFCSQRLRAHGATAVNCRKGSCIAIAGDLQAYATVWPPALWMHRLRGARHRRGRPQGRRPGRPCSAVVLAAAGGAVQQGEPAARQQPPRAVPADCTQCVPASFGALHKRCALPRVPQSRAGASHANCRAAAQGRGGAFGGSGTAWGARGQVATPVAAGAGHGSSAGLRATQGRDGAGRGGRQGAGEADICGEYRDAST